MTESPQKNTFRIAHGSKTKYALAIVVAALLLGSFFLCLATQNGDLNRWMGIDYVPNSNASRGEVTSGEPVNSSVWQGIAANAWAYFQPGVGVNSNTGLPYASGTNFEAFTSWDLGVYIQAIIDAQKLGLVGVDGAWGSNARIEKVMNFLMNRPLNASTGYPFWYYDGTNGKDYYALSDKASAVDISDTGRLFDALYNLKEYNSSLAASIDYLVYNQSDYAALLPNVEADASSNNIYAYYIDSGFASFWPQQVGDIPNKIAANIAASPCLTTYGVSLPNATLTSEPLLCSVFELASNQEINQLMWQVYQAHEGYYNATGKYAAFSEGNSFGSQYLYEWIVAPNNGGTWKIGTTTPNVYLNMDPIAYTKVAYSFLAIYNSSFAQNLVVHLEKTIPKPTDGYSDGADSSGQCVPGAGCNTNGLILDAVVYALQSST